MRVTKQPHLRMNHPIPRAKWNKHDQRPGGSARSEFHMSVALSARIFDGVMGAIDLLGMKRWRARTAARPKGMILEIGAGGGRNSIWLDAMSTVALDPDVELLKLARAKARGPQLCVAAKAEDLPFRDGVFDAAVATLVLCSVDDQRKVASELKRTLRTGGTLHAIDHVLAEGPTISKGQRRLAPGWHRMTGSCQIDRPTLEVLASEGFDITRHQSALRGALVRYEATPVDNRPQAL